MGVILLAHLYLRFETCSVLKPEERQHKDFSNTIQIPNTWKCTSRTLNVI